MRGIYRSRGGSPGVRQEGSVVEVADDGPGISEAEQSRIFDPCFTARRSGRGTGLELSLPRRIVLQHRGELHLESEPGETCFRVRLPVRAAV